VPPNLRSAYVSRRTAFFSNLTGFFRENIEAGNDDYTQDDLKEAEASLTYLKGLQTE
jgi:hypothetical protein